MKLYYSPGACSLANHIVMAELGMAYEIEAVNLTDKSCNTGDYKAINMKGSVPALKMDSGDILTEGAIISQYLADFKNDGMMLGKFGTTERFRTLEWMNFIAMDIHKNYSALFGANKNFTNTDSKNDVKAYFTNVLKDKLNYLAEKLGPNHYLMGNQFTIADAYLFTCLSWSNYVGVDINNWSNLNTYMKRISERPAVMKAMKEEGLLK